VTEAEKIQAKRRPRRIVLVVTVVVAVLAAIWATGYVAARVDRQACVTDVEVECRIAFGDGLVHLVDGDDTGLTDDRRRAELANDRLREVEAGDLCPSPGILPHP